MQYHLLTIAQKFEICYSTIGCYENEVGIALVEREIAELSSMIPMFTLCFIALLELPKAKNLQLSCSNAICTKCRCDGCVAMLMNLHAKRLLYIIGILNILGLTSKPTKEALDDYPNDQSKQPRTEFAIVAQRASSTFIILVLRVQESSFFNLFSTSKNCRFLC